MDLGKILAISGKPGLYKLVAQAKTGLIVESLVDKKRFPTHLTDKVNKLDDITVYSTDKDMPLREVLLGIFSKENGGPAAEGITDEKALKAYFESALPTYDKERVYISDIKKIINWYNILQKLGLIDTEEEKKEEKEEEKSPEKNEE